MARGKSSKFIKVLTSKDTELLKQLGRTGLSSRNQVEKYLGLSYERLVKLQNSKYIKLTEQMYRGKSVLIIQLDRKGKDHLKIEHNFSALSNAKIDHLDHDMKLTDCYYGLDKRIQETWKSENVIVKDIYSKDKSQKLETCIDATVEVNGELIGIEAVGSSYSQADIDEKSKIGINVVKCKEVLFI